SGGIAVKFPGRLGEAAVYGSGCWAQDPWVCHACGDILNTSRSRNTARRRHSSLPLPFPPRPPAHLLPSHLRNGAHHITRGGCDACRCVPGFAASVTGVGEAVVRADLARQCAAEALTAAVAVARTTTTRKEKAGEGAEVSGRKTPLEDADRAAAADKEPVEEEGHEDAWEAAESDDGNDEEVPLAETLCSTLLDRVTRSQCGPRDCGVLAARVNIHTVKPPLLPVPVVSVLMPPPPPPPAPP
ncbi:hypothetical protein Agub_g7123, partial [Astrephomene gubernaculifera]